MATAAVLGGSALLGAHQAKKGREAAQGAAATQAAAAQSAAELQAESAENIAKLQAQSAERAAGIQARATERAAGIQSETALRVADLRSQAAQQAAEIQELSAREATGVITEGQRQRLAQARTQFDQIQNNLATAEQQVQQTIQPVSDIELSGLQRQQQVLGGQAGLAVGAQQQLGQLLGLSGSEAQERAQRGILESPAQQALRERAARLSTRTASAIGGLGGGNIRRQLFEEGKAMDAAALERRIQQLGGIAQFGTQGLGLTGTTLGVGSQEAGAARQATLGTQRLGVESSLADAVTRARAAEITDPAAARAAGILGAESAAAAGIEAAGAAQAGGVLGTGTTLAGGERATGAALAGGLAGVSQATAQGTLAAAQAQASGQLGAQQARAQGIQGLMNLGVLAGTGAFGTLSGSAPAMSAAPTAGVRPQLGIGGGTAPAQLGLGGTSPVLASNLDI